MMSARVQGMGRLQSKTKKADLSIQASVFHSLKGLVTPIENDVKDSIRKPKSGPIVSRSNPARKVKVSLPGEAPADDRGLLVNSVEVEVDPQEYNISISAAAMYARFLELGTRKMLPRPFLRPALKRWRKAIVDAIVEGIKKGASKI